MTTSSLATLLCTRSRSQSALYDMKTRPMHLHLPDIICTDMLAQSKGIAPASCVRCSPMAARLSIKQHGSRLLKHNRASDASQQVTTQSTSASEQPPPGCARYTVKLSKPMGLVLEQDTKTMNIYVVDIKPEGSAARSGLISVGDQLIATTGVVYNSTSEYGEVKVRTGQQIVRMRVLGETFKTVSAAIGSHPGHIDVTMEFQKCDPK